MPPLPPHGSAFFDSSLLSFALGVLIFASATFLLADYYLSGLAMEQFLPYVRAYLLDISFLRGVQPFLFVVRLFLLDVWAYLLDVMGGVLDYGS